VTTTTATRTPPIGDPYAAVLPLVRAWDARTEPDGLVTPLVGDLATAYTLEDRDAVRTLTGHDLTRSGVSTEALHARALINLAQHVTRTGMKLQAYGSMMAVIFDGDMEATLLLYDPLWTRLHDEMGDHLVAVVPARDVLAVAPATSSEGIAELRAVVQRVFPRDDHALSRDFYGHHGGRWTALSIPR
jgi:hypothetical protein